MTNSWWENLDYRDQRKLKEHSHGEPLAGDLVIALEKAGYHFEEPKRLSPEEWHFIERQD